MRVCRCVCVMCVCVCVIYGKMFKNIAYGYNSCVVFGFPRNNGGLNATQHGCKSGTEWCCQLK